MSNIEQCFGNSDINDRLVISLQSDNKIKESSLKFASLKSNVERVDFVSDLLSVYKLWPKFISDKKDDEKSIEFRKKGNKLFGSMKDEEALEMYNYSVASAENNSENLGLAYANRSAVLFNVKMFDECLKDIQRAFDNNYPKSLAHKLEERKLKAENLKNTQSTSPYYQPKPCILPEKRNKFIDSASNSVEIRHIENMGRCVVATKPIEIGEIVAIEKPTFTLSTGKKWCHCYHCLVLCYDLIPCDGCTQALFCSEKCRETAKIYHDFECRLIATILSFDLNECRFLPFRIALLMTKDTSWRCDDDENDRFYHSGCYKEIHNLVTNVEHRSVSNLFERTTTATLFFHLIKKYKPEFFENEKKYEDIFKELTLRNLMIMACNFHEINELRKTENRVYELEQIGCGAYSFSSLLNHSCAPNVTRVSYGVDVVIIAIESIEKGDQLFDNYGYHYSLTSKKERQEGLKKQYFMECTCRACVNNWPIFNNCPSNLEGEGLNFFWENYDKVGNGDLETVEKIRDELKHIMKKLEIDMPNSNHCAFQELLKQCQNVYGNIRRELKNSMKI